MPHSLPAAADARVERSAPESHADPDAVDFRLLTGTIRRRWVLILATVVLALVLGAAYAVTSERQWSARVTLVSHSEGSGGAGQLAGLATQFGVRLPVGGGVANSPELFVELAQSMDLLRAVVATSYSAPGPYGEVREVTLMDVYDLEAVEPEARMNAAAGLLGKKLVPRFDRLAGTIEITAEAPAPALAVQITERTVELLNEFMLRLQQEQLQWETDFIESRVAEAHAELIAAEDALVRYLERNRLVGAEERVRAARLEQSAELERQRYLSLAQSFEQARLEQTRNIPLLSVIEHAEFTVGRAGPSTALVLALALILGIGGGLFAAFAAEAFARTRP